MIPFANRPRPCPACGSPLDSLSDRGWGLNNATVFARCSSCETSFALGGSPPLRGVGRRMNARRMFAVRWPGRAA